MAVACAGVVLVVVVLHIGIQSVLTGSMRPTYGPGAVLVTRPVPVRDLRTGMIIVFVPPGRHVPFAHRITSVTGPPSAPVVTTKGDANRAPDPWHARLTTPTVPEVVATVPWVGRVLFGLRGSVKLLLIAAGGLVVAVAGTRRILRPRPLARSTIA